MWQRFRSCVLLLALAGCALAAQAGSISFSLALTGQNLAIVNTGDSVAFFPNALVMQGDGRWQQLVTPKGEEAPTQLAPGERILLVWPEPRPLASLSALARLRPTMVRFFDQTGVGFGQISFLGALPEATATVAAAYVGGRLWIAPPRGEPIVATWVLWPQEEGIRGIRGAFKSSAAQPSAQRIDWRADAHAASLDTGYALPAAMLIHETAQGYRLQRVAGGWAAGRQQRAPWLDAGPWFYGLALLLLALAALSARRWVASMSPQRWSPAAAKHLDAALSLALAAAAAVLIATTLGIGFLDSDNWPTGGDTASHLLYAKLYADEALWSGQILPWMPEVFAGFPFLSYYFPLPFMVIAALAKPLGVASGFKWGVFLASMLLPGAVLGASRYWLGFAWRSAALAGLAALGFLLHEQNSIWGGNLLSTLAGEFAYSYGLLFALLALLAWSRAAARGRGWVAPALLEAASGFSHGFPLLVVGCSTLFLLLDAGRGRRRAVLFLLLRGHALAFCLLGGWLWPMLEMHGLTIANDASFPLSGWRDLLPATLWPVAGMGVVGLGALAFTSVRSDWTRGQAQAARYLAAAAGIAAVAFIAGDQMGFADIRFFPMVWLFAGVVCAWLFGQALAALTRPLIAGLLAGAVALALLGWFGAQINAAPDWGLWNHSGLDAKPQWQVLTRLFPQMRGELFGPRLLFEHDPDNNDIGSTRTLEALSMFLNQRPVLEGLYMESALLGPAVYQLQSEVSARPSSPLVRFPSGALDPEFAVRHMKALHAELLLLRSAKAQAAIEASGLFLKVAASPPFALYRVGRFDSELMTVLQKPLRWLPLADWMQDAFTWFKTRSRFDAYQPIYGEAVATVAARPGAGVVVNKLSRQEMVFTTEAVGSPHLLKVAYHPRWQLASRGSLRLAAPGFMMVVPEESEIRLVYGHTLIGRLGMAASAAALLLLVWIGYRRWRGTPAPVAMEVCDRATGKERAWWLAAAWLVLIAAGGYFAAGSPERVYGRAWEAMRANRYQEASDHFAQAYARRRPPAKREEALFWWAKSSELAGQYQQAIAHYQELVAHYHGYWLPESLYQLVHLQRRYGQAASAAPLIARLREEYPADRWTLKLEQEQR